MDSLNSEDLPASFLSIFISVWLTQGFKYIKVPAKNNLNEI